MRLLDLFCGAGGCAVGYARAGFTEIVGIDLRPQPRYPFRFVQGDALRPPVRLADFDAVHASPPCQAFSTVLVRHRGKGGRADAHADLVSATRDLICGRPYVIENVPGAKRALRAPVTLNGGMFGLGVDRPRLFETNFPILVPDVLRVPQSIGVYGRLDGRRLWIRADGSIQRAARTLEEGRAAMAIDWMTWYELTQAIPPVYTELIGRQLIDQLREAAA